MNHIIIRYVLGAMCMVCTLGAAARQLTSVEQYLSANSSRYVSQNIICDGCYLHVSADASALCMQLYVRPEALQRSLLHRGVALAVDPEGKHQQLFLAVFQPVVIEMPQPPQPPDSIGERRPPMERPDSAGREGGAPLPAPKFSIAEQVAKADSLPVVLCTPTDTTYLPPASARVNRDEDGVLIYTVVLPLAEMKETAPSAKKWKFGVLAAEPMHPDFEAPRRDGAPGREGDASARRFQEMPPSGGPGMGGPGMGAGPGRGGPPDFGGRTGGAGTDKDLQRAVTRAIDQWKTIPISEFLK